MDRLLWVGLARVWAGWRQALVIVSPDTVLRWQRRRFREHWTRFSGRPVGRPPINAEITALIRNMTALNPLWGAPRIHGELRKLGIEVAERTVSRLMPKRRAPPSQTWRTFLANHVPNLVSLDFFTVPTAGLRVLFVLVVLAHHRRRVVQIVTWCLASRFATEWRACDSALPVAKSLRRALDRIDPARVSESRARSRRATPPPHPDPLLRLLPSGAYPTHLALDKDAPDLRPIELPAAGKIVQVPEVGGLHHRYLRQAA
jgi:hypothetical protein